MKKKFAFFLMGEDYNPNVHNAQFETENCVTYIFTVRNFEEAKEKAVWCKENNFGVIEICGAFGEEKAKELIKLTDDKMGVGFIIHFTEQDSLFNKFFSRK